MQIAFDPELIARSRSDEELAALMSGEAQLFEARTRTYLEERAQLEIRVEQIGHEITGLEGQTNAANRQRTIINEEMEIQKGLHEKGLAGRTQLIERRLEAVRVERELAAITSRIAEARSRIGETQISLARLAAERLEQIVTELRELEIESLDLMDEIRKVDDELASIDVTAPVTGVVHASRIHTQGAVIGAGGEVLAIVPLAERLLVEARVPTTSIDEVRLDQEAQVRFPAFNPRTTPELIGKVERISADRMVDEATAEAYYEVDVEIPAQQVERLEGRRLIPGMPTEVFMRTSPRTPLSYLVTPLTEHVSRAMREE